MARRFNRERTRRARFSSYFRAKRENQVVKMEGNEGIENSVLVRNTLISPRYWDIHGISMPLEMNMNEVLW